MGVWLGPQKRLPFFEITGTKDEDYYYAERIINGVRYWEIAILNDQTISFKKDVLVDIFLAGHGNSGGESTYQSSQMWGCAGGKGGNWYTNESSLTLQKNLEYNIEFTSTDTLISIQGTTIYTTENSNNGKAGGTRGRVTNGYAFDQPHSGTEGIYAYNDKTNNLLISATKLTFQRFCAGGGAGNVFYYNNGSDTYCSTGSVDGGEDSGGKGGTEGNIYPSSGISHSGSGGGGGVVGLDLHASLGPWDPLYKSSSAAGGSGIVLIRAHRNLTKASS